MTAPGARNPDPRRLAAACPPRPRDRHGAQCAGAPDDARPAGTVVHTTARRDRLDEAIAGLYHDGELAPTARRLACLRGVSALTAVSLAVEIGDQGRFKGSTIASYLGLVPSEHPCGAAGRPPGAPSRRPASTHARRLLIEAARTPRPRLPALQGHTGALGPGPRTGRGTGRCRQPPPARPLPGPDRPRQEARRGRHRHRPRERRLAVVPGNHGRLGPARPPRPELPPRPERLNQVRRNHDLTHQTRSPARRGHTAHQRARSTRAGTVGRPPGRRPTPDQPSPLAEEWSCGNQTRAYQTDHASTTHAPRNPADTGERPGGPPDPRPGTGGPPHPAHLTASTPISVPHRDRFTSAPRSVRGASPARAGLVRRRRTSCSDRPAHLSEPPSCATKPQNRANFHSTCDRRPSWKRAASIAPPTPEPIWR